MYSTERPVLIKLKKRLKTQLTPWFCYENDYNLWKVRHFFRKTSQPDPLHHCHRCSGIFLQGEGGSGLGMKYFENFCSGVKSDFQGVVSPRGDRGEVNLHLI